MIHLYCSVILALASPQLSQNIVNNATEEFEVEENQTRDSIILIGEGRVHEATTNHIAIEAEHYQEQIVWNVRQWHTVTKNHTPVVEPDGDPPHVEGASNGAYLEILPDTRRTHDDQLIRGENFINQGGEIAVLTYRVRFAEPGTYYVWVRAYSSGTEDNGIHVGLDGTWPESGARMQWCEGKHSWRWESKQRTQEEHCGVPYQIFLEVEKPGLHEVQFSMREDGFEFDKFILTTNREFTPEGYTRNE